MATHRSRPPSAPLKALAVLAVGASVALAALLGGCSSDGAELGTGDPGFVPVTPVDACADPAEGCPCASAGETALCGKVSQTYDDYVVCTRGTTTCDGSRWGQCLDDGTSYTRSLAGIELQNIAATPGACVNACSQSCATFVDTPTGVDAGAGILSGDGGLTLEPKPATVISSCTSLLVTPNTAPGKDIAITSLAAVNSVKFTAVLYPLGCFTGVVKPLWSIDRFDIAQIADDGTLRVVTPIAGPIEVRAFVGTLTGNVTSNVTVAVIEKGTSNPDGSGATASSYPAENPANVDSDLELLYPYTNTVLPLGLAPPLVQWRKSLNASSVLVSLRYPAGSATPIYSYGQILAESQTFPVPLRPAQPRAQLDAAHWSEFEQTVNRNRGAYGDVAEIVVRRIIAGSPKVAKTIRVRFAAGQLKGRVYYNSYGTSLVKNFDGAMQSTNGAFPGGQFGAATLAVVPGQAAPSIVAGLPGSGGCRVCHSANATGSVLVTAQESAYDIYKYVLPGSGPAGTYLTNKKLVFPGVNPDASRFFSNSGAFSGDSQSRLYDGAGNTISGATTFTNLKAAYPAFAHNGLAVAFTFRSGTSAPLGNTSPVNSGTLSMMSFDGNKTFSNFRNLHTPAAGLSVWPTFLPPSQNAIVFQREVRTNGNGGYGETRSDCDSKNACNDGGTTGELWWVTTGATPVAKRLDNLNGWSGGAGSLPTGPNRHGGPLSGDPVFYDQVYNYEPSALPVTVGGFSWVAFTSRRMYGNVATINPYSSDPRFRDISIDPTPKKLWMSALAAGTAPGADPSAPAFYLPGQELIAGNARAVFALDSCRVAGPPTSDNLCDSDLDCCGAPATSACVLDAPPLANPPVRHCIALSGSCKADAEQCTQDAQCCSFSAGFRCASGTCQLPPPIFFDATYTRDYVATCGPGDRPVWRMFEWQSTTPVGTSIVFTGQTRETTADAWLPVAPVSLGTAAAPPITTTGWTNGGSTADARLRAVGQFSRSMLRVHATLKTNADKTVTPSLNQWRATFDCVAAE